MTIQIYHKERWVYLACASGATFTISKDRAYKFSKKDGERMEEEMKSLGFNVITA